MQGNCYMRIRREKLKQWTDPWDPVTNGIELSKISVIGIPEEEEKKCMREKPQRNNDPNFSKFSENHWIRDMKW